MWNAFGAQIESQLSQIPRVREEELASADALVIVDMNNGFAKSGALYSPRVEQLIPGIARLAARFRARGGRVIAYTDAHRVDDAEFARFPPHCLEGDAESQIVDELKPLVDEVIPKDSTNACLAPGAAVFPKGATVVVVGDCTDICILQYALAQRIRLDQAGGGRVIVPVEMVDTFDAPGHPATALNRVALTLMINGGVEVVSVQ